MRNWLGLNKFTLFFGPFFLFFLLVSSFSEISSGTGAYFSLAQRILNWPGFLTVTWFGSSLTPLVPLPPTNCFSFLVLARVGEEPTYTTVRKPGLQLITKYSLHRLAGFANCAPTSGIQYMEHKEAKFSSEKQAYKLLSLANFTPPVTTYDWQE